jgi:hypothetical protein
MVLGLIVKFILPLRVFCPTAVGCQIFVDIFTHVRFRGQKNRTLFLLHPPLSELG